MQAKMRDVKTDMSNIQSNMRDMQADVIAIKEMLENLKQST